MARVYYMHIPEIDFFQFFRYLLGTVVTIYASIISLQSLWGWIEWLSGKDKYITLIRRYVIVHGLRLRFKSFMGDVVICLLLTVTCVLIAMAHYQMKLTFESVNAVRFGR